jgi:hypothetical protein
MPHQRGGIVLAVNGRGAAAIAQRRNSRYLVWRVPSLDGIDNPFIFLMLIWNLRPLEDRACSPDCLSKETDKIALDLSSILPDDVLWNGYLYLKQPLLLGQPTGSNTFILRCDKRARNMKHNIE